MNASRMPRGMFATLHTNWGVLLMRVHSNNIVLWQVEIVTQVATAKISRSMQLRVLKSSCCDANK